MSRTSRRYTPFSRRLIRSGILRIGVPRTGRRVRSRALPKPESTFPGQPGLLFPILLLVLSAAAVATASETAEEYREVLEKGWSSPPSSIQLDREGVDDKKGLGRLFLPTMSSREAEPFYVVFKGDKKVGEMPMGSSIFLRPGRYTVKYGSGTLDQMMSREVDIIEEDTLVLEPDWCALTVHLIDESRNDLTLNYEVFRMPEGESFGIGSGYSEEFGEQVRTIILPAGLYKIVRLGESYSTYTDFASVRMIPGHHTRFTIVIDSESEHFIGSGMLGRELRALSIRSWRVFGSFSGSFMLSRDEEAGVDEPTDNMTFTTQFDTRIKYDRRPHYFLSNSMLELAWNKQEGLDFRAYLDRLELKNTYIYYFLSRIGLYGSLRINTKLLPAYHRDIPDSAWVVKMRDGSELGRWTNVDDLAISPMFSPVTLKEGLGISLALLKSSRFNLNLRTGFGLQQTFNRDVFVYSPGSSSDSLLVFEGLEPSYVYGTQATMVGYFRIFRRVVITTDLDFIFPFKTEDPVMKYWENIVNFRLSKNLYLDYRVRMSNEETGGEKVLTDQNILVRLSWLIY